MVGGGRNGIGNHGSSKCWWDRSWRRTHELPYDYLPSCYVVLAVPEVGELVGINRRCRTTALDTSSARSCCSSIAREIRDFERSGLRDLWVAAEQKRERWELQLNEEQRLWDLRVAAVQRETARLRNLLGTLVRCSWGEEKFFDGLVGCSCIEWERFGDLWVAAQQLGSK